MKKLVQRIFGNRSKELQFSYEEKKYSIGVTVLVVLLTVIVLTMAERAMVDLKSGIPRVPYPSYNAIPEQQELQYFRNNVLQPLYSQRRELEREIQVSERQYDSTLLEKIAGEEESLYGGQENVRTEYTANQVSLEELNRKIGEGEKQLYVLQRAADSATKPLRKKYEWAVKIRQVHVFVWEALFWVPFFFITLWWYSRSKRKSSRWEVISLSSLVAASIISLQSFCIFIWSWIPKMFLEWLWELLQATLVTRIVGYYLMMALVVLLLGGLIVSVHRRATDPVRGGKRKIRNGQCPTCSYPLNLSNDYCGGCAKQLRDKCSSCKKETYTWSAACESCGKTSSSE